MIACILTANVSASYADCACSKKRTYQCSKHATSLNNINPSSDATESIANEAVVTGDISMFGDKDLSSGYDQNVKHLQVYLNAYFQKYGCSYDTITICESGIFDDDTESALREFQMIENIDEYGFAGNLTKKRLVELMGTLVVSPVSDSIDDPASNEPSTTENTNTGDEASNG